MALGVERPFSRPTTPEEATKTEGDGRAEGRGSKQSGPARLVRTAGPRERGEGGRPAPGHRRLLAASCPRRDAPVVRLGRGLQGGLLHRGRQPPARRLGRHHAPGHRRRRHHRLRRPHRRSRPPGHGRPRQPQDPARLRPRRRRHRRCPRSRAGRHPATAPRPPSPRIGAPRCPTRPASTSSTRAPTARTSGATRRTRRSNCARTTPPHGLTPVLDSAITPRRLHREAGPPHHRPPSFGRRPRSRGRGRWWLVGDEGLRLGGFVRRL